RTRAGRGSRGRRPTRGPVQRSRQAPRPPEGSRTLAAPPVPPPTLLTLETAGWGGSLHARFSSARTRKPRESRASAYGRSRGDAEARGTASARREVSGDTCARRESGVINLARER